MVGREGKGCGAIQQSSFSRLHIGTSPAWALVVAGMQLVVRRE